MTVPAPVERPAGRLICLDPAGAVLVHEVVDPAAPDEVRWVVPGGAVEPGETPAEAAAREAWEELGLVLDGPGEPVATSTDEFGFDGRRYLARNTVFAVRTARFVPRPRAMDAAELAFTRAEAWLLPDELDERVARGDVVGPAALAGWVRRLHVDLPPATLRPTVRVLVVDDADRVLLMRVDGDAGPFWFPPGGGVEIGESVAEAARRELAEELGLHLPDGASAGVHVWNRRHVLPGDDARPGLDLRERWHLLRLTAAAGGPASGLATHRAGWTPLERATVVDVRWWSVAEIEAESARAGGDAFTPRDLARRLPGLLARDRAGHRHEVEEVGV